jgi:hypothetical protein
MAARSTRRKEEKDKSPPLPPATPPPGRPSSEDVVRLIEQLDPCELERLIEFLCGTAAFIDLDDSDPLVRQIKALNKDATLDGSVLVVPFTSVTFGSVELLSAGEPMRITRSRPSNSSKLAREIQARSLRRPDTVAGYERISLGREASALKRKLGGRKPTPRNVERDEEVTRLFRSGRSDEQIRRYIEEKHPAWKLTERGTPVTASTIRAIRRKLGVKRDRGQITSGP